MPSGSIFSLLKELIEDCQKFRDTDDRGCDGPGSQECVGCDYIKDAGSDITELVIKSLRSDEVRDAIYEVVQ